MMGHGAGRFLDGYPVIEDVSSLKVEPDAVRMLPEEADATAVAIGGDVLHVLMPNAPTPAQFTRLEQMSGMAVTISLVSRSGYQQVLEAARAALPANAPRAIGAVLAAASDATDVLLTAGDLPRARLNGAMAPLDRFPIQSASDVEEAAAWLCGRAPGADEPDLRAVTTYADTRWRVNAFRSGGNLSLLARRLPTHPPRLEELALPSAVVELAQARNGLILFTGPASSGKTTSAAALLDRINGTRRSHIITVEDPIEYRHQPLSCAVTQRQVGLDVDTVADGVDAALWLGPEVLLIGELLTTSDMQAALRAAASGHLVIATLRATGVEAALHRILTSCPDAERAQARAQLANCLRAVVGQTLVPAADGGGAQLVCEVLLANDAVRTVIREGRTLEIGAVIADAVSSGMTSRERSLAAYVTAGRITEQVALEAAAHPDRVREQLRHAQARRAADGNAAAAAGPVTVDALGQPSA